MATFTVRFGSSRLNRSVCVVGSSTAHAQFLASILLGLELLHQKENYLDIDFSIETKVALYDEAKLHQVYTAASIYELIHKKIGAETKDCTELGRLFRSIVGPRNADPRGVKLLPSQLEDSWAALEKAGVK